MALTSIFLGSSLASIAFAAQPGAVSPVHAPMRDLVWGQLNFLHTTDTHGWHGGHLLESQYSADWGDYISFAHHMRKKADEAGSDLLLVDTGDRVEGNGLYDSSDPKGKYYYDIFREQDIDIISVGNHELYQAKTAEEEYRQTVPNFKDSYIASNLDYVDPKTNKTVPLAQRYRKFQTKNQKLNIVAFGFLFDFTGNANNTVVQPVAQTVEEEWFQQAVREKADLIVVIGHVGIRMLEFKTIFTAIRKYNWLTPVAFFGGHAHVRDATTYGPKSFALASGRYFETIGWMSIDGLTKKTIDSDVSTEAVSFNRRYIDNNLLGLYYHSGLNESTFPTEQGKKVTKMIAKARKALDLDHSFGCAPQDYWMSRAAYPGNTSIFTWLETEVLPDIAYNAKRADVPRLAILNTGTIRFDIFKGPFTIDSTFIVCPFLSKLQYIPDVPYEAASKVLKLLNNAGQIMSEGGLDPRFMTIPEQFTPRQTISQDRLHTLPESTAQQLPDFRGQHQRPLSDIATEPELVSGYTTRDDIGTDGDDAVHSPLNFYDVPNCIQAEVGFPTEGKQDQPPQTVDLVFLDFIQPWVLLALRFSGGDYNSTDVQSYRDETFTELMADWIHKNWEGNC